MYIFVNFEITKTLVSTDRWRFFESFEKCLENDLYRDPCNFQGI